MMSMARPEPSGLLHSTVIGMFIAGLVTVAIALLGMSLLKLSAFYPAKTLAVFVFGAALVLFGLCKHHPFHSIGLANQATIARGMLVALLAGLVWERGDSGVPAVATAAALVATILDGVDGWLARRTNMASGFGARFDMETDAVLILVLAVLAWQFGKAPAWVLWSGLLRYAFIAAGAVLGWLRSPLPPSFRRKTVAAVQTIALIVVIAPFVGPALSTGIAAFALLTLTLSFLLDIAWLLRNSI